jgi:two-component system alkaline phosphatase synthesis response regulator PhoP
LLARIAAVLRRSRIGARQVPRGAKQSPWIRGREPGTGANGAEFCFGDVVVDLDTRTVSRSGKSVRLTHLEFELLSFFCRSSRRVYSREHLLREVWGLRQAGQARTVDNFMAQLRSKLEVDPERPRHLLTVRGSGYRFVPD